MSELRFRAMGCDVVAVGERVEEVRALFEHADARFTRFRSDSELAHVNRAGGPVLVSAAFARAVRVAMRARRQTDGLVDPTLLDAIEAAGYDRDWDELDPARGPEQRLQTGEVRITGRVLLKSARLDLNGVVKSLAVDDALALVGDGWVSAGGDLATSRPLEVELPRGGQIRLESGALATSGRATRHWIREGVEQHHLIDPRTGAPSDSPWEQVTVCGATCVDADVAAKAAFLLGEHGPDWLDDRRMAGRFVGLDGRIHLNRAWSACT